jgi:hypothetical protein
MARKVRKVVVHPVLATKKKIMPLLIGAVLALAVGMMATAVGLDRDRAFYPTVMIVIAAIYPFFAVLASSTHALLLDALVGSVFIALSLWGFRSSLWIVAAALALHGVMDIGHHRFIFNPGVPAFWPAFCSAYDVIAAAYLAWLLKTGHSRATA